MAALLQRPGSKIFYIQYSVAGKKRRVSTGTEVLQIAKEKLRQFESAQANGTSPLPSRTPIPIVVSAYARFIRATKTFKSAMTDIYYLRQMFGPVCPELEVTSRRKRSPRKRPLLESADRRCRLPVIEAPAFEAIHTSQVSQFISAHVEARGLAPKTANRYREILHRVFNWGTRELGIRTPGNVNPVRAVLRRREHAPHIRFLTLEQVDEQLVALKEQPTLQTMVAVLIYAGLRREEMLWLQVDDIDHSVRGNGIIRIRKKEVDGESWQPKTKVNRAVPISSALNRYLAAYRAPTSSGRWYFPNASGGRWNPDVFSEALREANVKLGLRWSCLHYRHTFGSQLAQKGESLFKIATLMGNSPEICRRHYAALVPEAMTDSVEFPVLASVTPQTLEVRG